MRRPFFTSFGSKSHLKCERIEFVNSSIWLKSSSERTNDRSDSFNLHERFSVLLQERLCVCEYVCVCVNVCVCVSSSSIMYWLEFTLNMYVHNILNTERTMHNIKFNHISSKFFTYLSISVMPQNMMNEWCFQFSRLLCSSSWSSSFYRNIFVLVVVDGVFFLSWHFSASQSRGDINHLSGV